MKALMAMVCVGVVAMCCGCGVRTESKAEAISASDRALKDPATFEVAEFAPSDDAGTDIVMAFYKALLQKEPVTLEQEKALLTPAPGLRRRLILGGLGKETEPVLLNFVRERKALFLPQKMRSLNQIVISSSFVWVRSLDRLKERKANSDFTYVLVNFSEVPGIDPVKRTIVFSLERGKIDVDGIRPEGFDGDFLLNEFLKVKLENEPFDTWPGSGHGDH